MVVRLVEADPLTLYLFWWRLCSDRGYAQIEAMLR